MLLVIGRYIKQESTVKGNMAHINRCHGLIEPLPKEGGSSESRWEAIYSEIREDSNSAMDVGCNLGYFVLKLSETGLFGIGIGIDTQPSFKFLSAYAAKKAGLNNAAFYTYVVNPKTIDSLPSVDVTIFFSVWHHWITNYGYDAAKIMLSKLWHRTKHTMFFETGEDSEISLLQVKGRPALWVEEQLALICKGGGVRCLGVFDKGEHKTTRGGRSLFLISRKDTT